MEEKLLLWLWLNKIFGDSNPRKWEATARFDSLEECYDAFMHGDFYGLTEQEIRKIKTYDINYGEKILEYCRINNIKVYCYESEGFPSRLREIYNPPAVIYAKHSAKSLDFLDDNVVVSIVGARKITDYYTKVTTLIAKELAQAGIIIASGFALGVDSCANRAAISVKGRTIAVLGSGIDYDYPGGTMKFKDEIAENGLVFSEYSPLTPAKPGNFKARNRLLSGIAMGVLVTQASNKSGSLNTVSHALSQGRDIFCVPPADIFNENYSGVVDILRDGATPVFGAKDILFEYCENYSHRLDYARNMMDFSQRSTDSSVYSESSLAQTDEKTQPAARDETKDDKDETVQENTEETVSVNPEKEKEIDMDSLSEVQKNVVKLLQQKPLHLDEIIACIDGDRDEIEGEVFKMEVSGIIKSYPGHLLGI